MQVWNLNQYAQIMTGMLSLGKTSVRRQKTEARTYHSTASVVAWYYKFLLKVVFMSCFVLHIFWFYFLNIQSCTCLNTSLYTSIYKKMLIFLLFFKSILLVCGKKNLQKFFWIIKCFLILLSCLMNIKFE